MTRPIGVWIDVPQPGSSRFPTRSVRLTIDGGPEPGSVHAAAGPVHRGEDGRGAQGQRDRSDVTKEVEHVPSFDPFAQGSLSTGSKVPQRRRAGAAIDHRVDRRRSARSGDRHAVMPVGYRVDVPHRDDRDRREDRTALLGEP
jgi:hypothetical protein